MTGRFSFRLTKKSYRAFCLLKAWCRVNRIPLGRLLNTTIQAMEKLPPPSAKQATIVIPYPKQTDIDDRIRYLTRRQNDGEK